MNNEVFYVDTVLIGCMTKYAVIDNRIIVSDTDFTIQPCTHILVGSRVHVGIEAG